MGNLLTLLLHKYSLEDIAHDEVEGLPEEAWQAQIGLPLELKPVEKVYAAPLGPQRVQSLLVAHEECLQEGHL